MRSLDGPVGVALRVERTHVVDLLEVDVGKDQLVVGGIDDGGSIGAGKDVGGREGSEGPQHGGLSAEGDFLTLTEDTWEKGIKLRLIFNSSLKSGGISYCLDLWSNLQNVCPCVLSEPLSLVRGKKHLRFPCVLVLLYFIFIFCAASHCKSRMCGSFCSFL